MREPFRCYRDSYCGMREPVRDPVTGDFEGYVGCWIDDAQGLCEIDVDKVKDALERLPGDVVELTALLAKPLTYELGDVVSTGKGPRPTIPIREHLHALRDLIVFEAFSWARSVVQDQGEDLSTLEAHHSRIGYRTDVSCMILRRYLPVLLNLGPVEHRARSLSIRRTDGHDEDVATRYGDDYWTTRIGLDGALVLLDLHEKAWKIAQRHTTPVPVFVPCPRCSFLALKREVGSGTAECSWCHHVVSEKHLDTLQTALANSTPAA